MRLGFDLTVRGLLDVVERGLGFVDLGVDALAVTFADGLAEEGAAL